MAKADSNTTTPVDPSRRRFMTVAAAASAVSAGALAAAAMPATALQSGSLEDSALVKLEEQIFELQEAATAYDDEIIRVANIWHDERERLADESRLTPKELSALIANMPECIEHNRLCRLQDPFYARMDALIKEMFATPAHTAEGRRAKVTVLLSCIMGDEWRDTDEKTDYSELMARKLLIEFIGGEPGEQLRQQFV